MTPDLLHVENLSYSYYERGALAIQGVSLKLRAGGILGIIGRNGAGKTTLLETLQGLRRALTGTVTLAREDVTACDSQRRARRGLALVQQGRQIFPRMTAEENLRVGLESRTDRLRTLPESIRTMFDKFSETDFLKRLAGNLSGGEQQQLLIARALAGDPKVLLLDEPTEGVDQQTRQKIGQTLRKLARPIDGDPLGIILVEQNEKFITEFADDDSVYGMKLGRFEGPIPKSKLASYLSQSHN